MNYEFCCPTLFGLEGIVGDELRHNGGLTDVRVENGRVFFSGDEHTLAWANLNLRCAERVLIKVGEFPAQNFEELFEGVYELPWLDYIEKDCAFPVKGYSLDSQLHSIPDCQSIIKKAIVKSLSESYGITWFEERGARCQVQFSIVRDIATLYLDTSGAGLHKRGYRANANEAPLRETLAAAMVKISRFRGKGEFFDPFCGSGTIPIEAAMIAMNLAPGLKRSFDAEKWEFIAPEVWQQERERALDGIYRDRTYDIHGCDIDPAGVELSIANAKKAGVEHTIHFEEKDACACKLKKREGTLIANPPYGERMMDVNAARKLLRGFGAAAAQSPMKQYIISSDEQFEEFYGMKADKKRKLYNGMLRCNLYMYYQPPEKRRPFRTAPTGKNRPQGGRTAGKKRQDFRKR